MNDTTAAVTGTSFGVDAAVTHALDRAGATVIACARDGDTFQSIVNDIGHDGGSASATRADVRDELSMERLMETAARTGGHTDALVTNTAVAHRTPDEMPTPEDSYVAFDDTLRTDVHGVLVAVREALPHMADDGRVLVPSDSTTREAKPRMGACAVSKATAEALVRQFAVDCDRTVTAVGPGLVATNLTGRQGRNPDDVADLLVWTTTGADPAGFDDDIADLEAWKRAMR